MNESRLEAALHGLAVNVPRAPEMSVEAMVKTVRALNNERTRRMGLAGDAPAAANERELAPRAEIKKPQVKKTL